MLPKAFLVPMVICSGMDMARYVTGGAENHINNGSQNILRNDDGDHDYDDDGDDDGHDDGDDEDEMKRRWRQAQHKLNIS